MRSTLNSTALRLMLGGRTAIPARRHSAISDDDAIGVAKLRGEQCRHELNRIIRLQVGGLGGDDRVCRAVRLREPIAGESLDHGEDFRRQSLLDPAFAASRNKSVLVLRHLLGQLLAHRLAQTVALGHGKPGEDVCDPDHLLLIERHAVRLAQNRLHVRMDIFNRRAPVLSRDVLWRHRHWAGPDQAP